MLYGMPQQGTEEYKVKPEYILYIAQLVRRNKYQFELTSTYLKSCGQN